MQWTAGNSRTFRPKCGSGLSICGPLMDRVALTPMVTGYDMRRGQYWVPIECEWYPIPREAVIKTANPVGEAIAWYQSQSRSEYEVTAGPKYGMLCFVPSDGV
jgi:hypothetical protein